ncbi:hypothetical protein FOL46_003905 [Perkinsus olseni]|uniref:Ubiquitinyl hydrolase 1 n=1 Tax=Perkinsus olseni TaxID=32597 RepID=A0A7J6M1D9_PEROL|nr:hypothetical protein FOL46_003905 [Perkinsus olseni]
MSVQFLVRAPTPDTPSSVVSLLPYYNLPANVRGLRWSDKRSVRPVKGDAADVIGSLNLRDGVWRKKNFVMKELGLDKGFEPLRTGPFAGIRNLGATCYVNSLLQALFFTKPFRTATLNLPTAEPNGRSSGFNQQAASLRALQVLFGEMQCGISATCESSVTAFLEACKIHTSTHEDPSELAMLLLSWLQRLIPKGVPDFVEETFGGLVIYETTCRSCGSISNQTEVFAEMRVPLPYATPTTTAGEVLLEGLVADVFAAEVFSDESHYYCCACGKYSEAVRRQWIKSAPPFLWITMHRYAFTDGVRRKILTELSFPLTGLDLTPFNAGVYDCVGALEHHSTVAHAGHYTATLKDHSTGVWWRFDDGHVREVDWTPAEELRGEMPSNGGESPTERAAKKRRTAPERARSRTAYMLLYVQQGYKVEECPELPSWLAAEINRKNEALRLPETFVHQRLCESASVAQETRRGEVRKLISELPQAPESVKSPADLVFVPALALKEWSKGTDVVRGLLAEAGVPNSQGDTDRNILETLKVEMVCKHDRVDPLSVYASRCRLLPATAVGDSLRPAVVPMSDKEGVCVDCCRDLHALLADLREFNETCQRLQPDPTSTPTASCVWVWYKALPRIKLASVGGGKKGAGGRQRRQYGSTPPSTPTTSPRLSSSCASGSSGSRVSNDVIWQTLVRAKLREPRPAAPWSSSPSSYWAPSPSPSNADSEGSDTVSTAPSSLGEVDLCGSCICEHGNLTTARPTQTTRVLRSRRLIERAIEQANSLSARLPTLVPQLRMDMWIPGDAQPCPVCRGGGKGSKTKAVSADKLSARSLDRVGSTTGLGASPRELLTGGLPSTPDVAEDGMPFPVFDAVDLEVRSKDWGGSASRGVRLGTLREIRPNTSGYDMRMQILTSGMVPKNVNVKLMLQVCKDAESAPEEKELADDARFGECYTEPYSDGHLGALMRAASESDENVGDFYGGGETKSEKLEGGRWPYVPEAMAGSNNNGTTTTAGGTLRFKCYPEKAPEVDNAESLLPFYNIPKLTELKWEVTRPIARHKEDPLDFMVDTAAATSKKGGIWLKSFMRTELSLDKKVEQFRKGNDRAGLRNLGATCYVNALLQALFAIKPFRFGIYTIPHREEGGGEGENDDGAWLKALQILFAEMQAGVSASCSTSVGAFIRACKLNSAVQEDASELATMLLSNVENKIPPGSPNFVQDTFCGSIRYSTQCGQCGNSVQRSERLSEIRICLSSSEPLKLEDSLARTFERENFSDYHCLNCDGRVEALRGQTIEKCPEILIIVIQRYLFEGGERKRLAAEVEFPLEGLDLSPYMTESEEGISRRAVYRCTGVLEHHGASASSGHYTATLLTGEGGGWMVFNDEKVGSHEWEKKEEAPRKKRRLSKYRKKRKTTPVKEDDGDDEDCTVVTESSGSTKRSPTALEEAIDEATPEAPKGASKTAYMLIYTRADLAQEEGSAGAGKEEEEALLPQWLREEVDAINLRVTSEVNHLEQATKAVDTAIEGRQNQLKSLVSTINTLGESTGASLDSLYFIDSKFVLQWCAGEDLRLKLEEQFGRDEPTKGCVSVGESPVKMTQANGQLPSSDVRCSHGKVDPSAAFRGEVKVIPSPLLQPEFEAVVVPAATALCYDCCCDLYEKKELLRKFESRCTKALAPPMLQSSGGKGGGKGAKGKQEKESTETAMINKLNIPSVPFGGTKGTSSRLKINLKVAPNLAGVYDNMRFWKLLIQYLVRGSGADEDTIDLVEGLVCPHGKTSDHAQASKYVSRPVECLEQLLDASERLTLALPGLQPKLEMSRWIPTTEPMCPECNTAKLEEEQRAVEEREKCHALLQSDGKAKLDDIPTDVDGEGGWSYLLPKKWFSSWREYLSRFGGEKKESGKKEEVKEVRKIYRSLLVCDHGNLRFDPRGRSSYDNKLVVVVSEEEGKYIEGKYANEDNTLPKVRRDAESNTLVFEPPVCDKGCCTTVTESNELLSLQPARRPLPPGAAYHGVSMKVRRLESNGRRLGRGSSLKNVEEVSSSCTGYDLKMLLLEQHIVDVPPRFFSLGLNMDLQTQTMPLDDETVLRDVCSAPGRTSIYVEVDDKVYLELSDEDRCNEILAAVQQYADAKKQKRADSDVVMADADDDDVVALDDVDGPTPPRPRDEGGLQGSVFRDVLPSPPPAATGLPTTIASTTTSTYSSSSSAFGLDVMRERAMGCGLHPRATEGSTAMPPLAFIRLAQMESHPDPLQLHHQIAEVKAVLEAASKTGPESVSYRGLDAHSLARYLLELQREEVAVLKAQDPRLKGDDLPPEDAHPTRSLTPSELHEASVEEVVAYLVRVREDGDDEEVERGLVALRQKVNNTTYQQRNKHLEGVSDQICTRAVSVLSAMENRRENPSRPSTLSRTFAPTLVDRCMHAPPAGGEGSPQENLMRDAAELMTEWISKQGDDGVDDFGRPRPLAGFLSAQPLRDCTIHCLLNSFLLHGPDHLPCLRLLEALFSVESVTDNVDLSAAIARDLRVLLDTRVHTELRLGRFAHMVIALTSSSSGGAELVRRLADLGVHSTLQQMPLLEARTKEEAEWARDEVEIALEALRGGRVVQEEDYLL